MNCHAAKKHIPLFVGGEISAAKGERVRRHLHACPACRAEAEELERSLRAIRGMAGAGAGGDWSPDEWSRMLRTITSSPAESRARAAILRLRPALAGALGVALMGGLILIQRELRRPSAPDTGSFAAISAGLPADAAEPAPSKDPEVKSVTIIAPESGVKIHWYYNKKFEWQGFGK